MADFYHDWNDVELITLDRKNKEYMARYGCSKQDMEDMMHEDRPYMLAMCILSDAQHVMEYDTEQARQFINKAKYVIRHMNRPTLDTLTPTTTN